MNDKAISGVSAPRSLSRRDQQRADALRKNLQKRKGQARVRDKKASSPKEK